MEVGDTGILVQEGEWLENWEMVNIYIEELPPKLPPRDGLPFHITVLTNGPVDEHILNYCRSISQVSNRSKIYGKSSLESWTQDWNFRGFTLFYLFLPLANWSKFK